MELPFIPALRPPLLIQLIVSDNGTIELILGWARAFRIGDLTVDEIQDRFAALDISAHDLAPDLQKRVAEAQQELDAIRFGMCESGQRAEVERIFLEIENKCHEFGPGNQQSRVEP